MDNACRTCGEQYPMAGDGWDGECGSRADRTAAAEDGETTCAHCGARIFFDAEDRTWRHDGHEGESCGELSPDTYAQPPVIATPHSQALWVLSGQGAPPTTAEDYADAERDIRRI